MNEKEITDIIERFYTGKFSTKDVYNLITDYCKDLNKDEVFIQSLFKVIQKTGLALENLEHIIYHFLENYNLITIHDKKGNFIKLYKNEKNNNTTICNN